MSLRGSTCTANGDDARGISNGYGVCGDVARNHGARADNATFANGDTVEHDGVRANPHIVLDMNADGCHTLCANRTMWVPELVVERHDHAAVCDSAVISDDHATGPVHDGEIVDRAVASYSYRATLRIQLSQSANSAVMANLDSPMFPNRRPWRNVRPGSDGGSPQSRKHRDKRTGKFHVFSIIRGTVCLIDPDQGRRRDSAVAVGRPLAA